jgi:hypothetical protein
MDAFGQQRVACRAQRLGLSQLACIGRHTLTGLLCTAGRQDRDWSADYRFFAQSPWKAEDLFGPVLDGMLECYPSDLPFVAAMDDTHLKKTGTKIPGVAYRRDPLSPAFATNFIRAQRFLQLSGLLPADAVPGAARAIPLHYEHVPPVPKPKKADPPEVWDVYRQRCKKENLSTAGAAAIRQLRRWLDERAEGKNRVLVMGVDGSYTNQTVLKNLPLRTALIGRVRKDAKLFYPPTADDQAPRGTHRQYGRTAPTPLELLKDDSIPWQEVSAYATGKIHTFRVKTIAAVLWAKAGARQPLRLVVVAPVGYRLHKGGKLLYRQPAYLICTDPSMSLQQLLQYYLWRWDIEVNHRDEKQLIGVGQAQVRASQSADRAPSFAVAAYAMLLLAAEQTYGAATRPADWPLPKWRAGRPKTRLSTQDLIVQLRQEIWGHALDLIEQLTAAGRKPHSDHFAHSPEPATKCQEFQSSLPSAILYAASG